jgi:hypothetical protein
LNEKRTDIGREADKLPREDIEVIEMVECPNRHEMPKDARFCQECGVAAK